MTNKSMNARTNHDKDDKVPSRENEISRLMQTYNLERQQAEEVLKRKEAPRIRGNPMIPVTHEELDKLLEEIARSGEHMSIGGKQKSADEKQQEDI